MESKKMTPRRVGRLALRWSQIALAAGALVVMLVMALAWVAEGLLSGLFPGQAGSFVTYVSDNDRGVLLPVFTDVNEFFVGNGLDIQAAGQLRFAYSNGGTLISCSLSEADLQKLLANKTRATSAAPEEIARLTEKYLSGAPFPRVKWWPPPSEEAAGREAYLGYTSWEKLDLGSGSEYLIIVDRSSDLVYMVGP